MEYSFEESIGKLSRQTAKGIGQLIDAKMKEKKMSYNSRDWMFISYIKNVKNISQTELNLSIGGNKVFVNRGMERLESLEIIIRSRDVNDQRIKRIQLTEKGKRVYRKMKEIVEDCLEQAFEGTSEEEKQTCLSVLDKVIGNCSR